jgi:hypothetical protein
VARAPWLGAGQVQGNPEYEQYARVLVAPAGCVSVPLALPAIFNEVGVVPLAAG